MMGHKICFYGEIWLVIPKLSLLSLLIWSTVRRGNCASFTSTASPIGGHLLRGSISLKELTSLEHSDKNENSTITSHESTSMHISLQETVP